jgi:hypothetical protein
MRAAAFFASLALLAGCQSYDIMQTNVFSDEDGDVIVVDYGRSDKEHVNTFVSPATGKEMEFKSKLAVRVTLSDGERFTAWQCMNFLQGGTMYKTDNEKWMFHALGLSCAVFRRTEEDPTRYLEVYRGILCSSPEQK